MRRFKLLILAICLVAVSCSYELPEFEFEATDFVTAQSSRIFDRNGTLITELRGEQGRTDIRDSADIPQVMRDAIVAIEDERFYRHNGVDLEAIIRAARSNVSAGGVSEGGSTITQQYVGNVYLDRLEDVTANRKINEIFMALRFEQQFTKDAILLKYLNWVNFGNGAYGVEAAAREYFGAPACDRPTSIDQPDDRNCLKASELTLEQAALLAGIVNRPGTYNPYNNPEAAKDRRDLVLDRMLANDFITEEEHEAAVAIPLVLVENVSVLDEEYEAGYFVEDVKQWFLDNDEFGATRDERIELLFGGGLTIETTIDLELQAQAEAGVEAGMAPEREYAASRGDSAGGPDAAAVILGTTAADDGHILAMVGGRDFFGTDDNAKFNLASESGRQAGSSMKPIALAAALQDVGIPITQTFPSPSFKAFSVPGGTWRVSGGCCGGRASLIQGTTNSVNTVYAQLMLDIGPETFVDMAERLGIGEDRIKPIPAAVLGTENVNMVEMATVFSTFAREGVRIDPVYVTRILNPDGTTFYEHVAEREKVLDLDVAHQIEWALSNVIKDGTGKGAQFGRPAAGKTGTTQNNADATFVGFTPQRTTAVWVGFSESQTPMKSPAVAKGAVYGGDYPATIFKNLMTSAHEGLAEQEFPTPPSSTTSTTTTTTVRPSEQPLVTVPDLIGKYASAEDVKSLVSAAGFKISTTPIPSTEYEPGQIVRQSPGGGTQARKGSTIVVEVAETPPAEPEPVTVPSVIGLSEAEARQILASDFGVDVVAVASPAEAPVAGAVWEQFPTAGTVVQPGVLVTIKVNP